MKQQCIISTMSLGDDIIYVFAAQFTSVVLSYNTALLL